MIDIAKNAAINGFISVASWLSVGDRAFNVAMIACMPPLGVVIWIGLVGA